MEPCPSYGRCGACQWLGTAYPEQLARKRETVVALLRSEGLRPDVQPVCGMEDPRFYRNKVIAAVTMQRGRVVCGLYEEESHRVVPLTGCQLQDRRLNAVIATLESLLNSLKIKPFGYGGVLKHVLLRIGIRSGQILLVLVTSEEMMHGRKELLKGLRSAHPEIVSVVQNIQPRQTSVVLGEREKVLFGPGYLVDELLGLRYKISARSFYQINPVQTERLYERALALSALRPDQTLLDAYCGIGTIGLSASHAQAGAHVIGVEINRDAVRDAVRNARENGVRGAQFHCADVSGFLREFEGRVDVLMLDPPRAGCEADFLRSVLRLRPERIVYISCNPATQVRDIAFLHSRGYRISSACYPFDLFPHTAHIENVVRMDRA